MARRVLEYDSDSESDLIDLESLTKTQLQNECVENGLPTTGTKQQLKDRLYTWDQATDLGIHCVEPTRKSPIKKKKTTCQSG